jgi:hypothetical protein
MKGRASPMMVLYNGYRIVRQDGGDLGARRALYFVQRPDGSECCRSTSWARAERVIRVDMRATGWPTDSLPPELAEALSSERRIPSPLTPAAGPSPTQARPARRPR